MNKADFLQNIANRLGRSAGQPASNRAVSGVPSFWAERVISSKERTDQFITNFTTLSGEVECFASELDLCVRLDVLLSDLGANSVGAWGKDALWPVNVSSVLNSRRALRWDQTSPAEYAHVQVGVTGCAFAIADTGTLVMTSSPSQGRGAHLLPTVHIVVMRETQIVQQLGQVFEQLVQPADFSEALPASVHFVSGASRSSDIENDQSIGVHGPARVIVLMLRESA